MLPSSTEQRTFLSSNKSQRGQLLDGKQYQNYEEENWRNSIVVQNFTIIKFREHLVFVKMTIFSNSSQLMSEHWRI
jgi:hypothetical protein